MWVGILIVMIWVSVSSIPIRSRRGRPSMMVIMAMVVPILPSDDSANDRADHPADDSPLLGSELSSSWAGRSQAESQQNRESNLSHGGFPFALSCLIDRADDGICQCPSEKFLESRRSDGAQTNRTSVAFFAACPSSVRSRRPAV